MLFSLRKTLSIGHLISYQREILYPENEILCENMYLFSRQSWVNNFYFLFNGELSLNKTKIIRVLEYCRWDGGLIDGAIYCWQRYRRECTPTHVDPFFFGVQKNDVAYSCRSRVHDVRAASGHFFLFFRSKRFSAAPVTAWVLLYFSFVRLRARALSALAGVIYGRT